MATGPFVAVRCGGAGNRSASRPWYTSSTRPAGASDARWSRFTPVQVTSHSQEESFSRFSHSGVVQMSFAWADPVQGRPSNSAA